VFLAPERHGEATTQRSTERRVEISRRIPAAAAGSCADDILLLGNARGDELALGGMR